MCPLRHDGEKITYLPANPSWIDEAIAEARNRGEFDDLPGAGQPLQIKENPLAGDWELAFHVLENAGMAPPWMELNREIREGLQELQELRQRAARQRAGQAVQPRFRWWPFRRPAQAPAPTPLAPRPPDLADLEAERQWARQRYLEKAAQVDELIATHNAWLTDDLRQLRKPRLSPAQAAADFDAACPPLRP